MPTASPREIIHAYRHLYRGLLRAVRFSKPSRYTARDQLRDAFRKEDPSTFNKVKIENTLEFLKLAGQEAGLEHRLLKNLLRINWERRANVAMLQMAAKKPAQARMHKTTMMHYDMTVAMLNDNMGLCLR